MHDLGVLGIYLEPDNTGTYDKQPNTAIRCPVLQFWNQHSCIHCFDSTSDPATHSQTNQDDKENVHSATAN